MSNSWIKCEGCNSNNAWILMKDTWVHRVTFSKALAEHINRTTGNEYQVKQVEVLKGRRLDKGEKSSTGIYALVDSRKNRILRVPLNYDVANLLCDYKDRYLTEAKLKV